MGYGVDGESVFFLPTICARFRKLHWDGLYVLERFD